MTHSPSTLGPLRQHLLVQGASSLTDIDLLSIVMGSAVLARSLPSTSSHLSDLGQADLLSLPNFGRGRTAQVLALVELSRRIISRPLNHCQAICCGEDVAATYGPLLFNRRQEVFIAPCSRQQAQGHRRARDVQGRPDIC